MKTLPLHLLRILLVSSRTARFAGPSSDEQGRGLSLRKNNFLRTTFCAAACLIAVGGCSSRTQEEAPAPEQSSAVAEEPAETTTPNEETAAAEETTAAEETAPAETTTQPADAAASTAAGEDSSESDQSTPPADRSLPAPPPTETSSATMPESTTPDNAAKDPASETRDEPAWEPEGPTAEEVARAAFDVPPGAKPLTQEGRLWVDPKQKRVYLDGYVALKRGPLEMFACPAGTKEHESIVAAIAKSREVHAALLAVGATPGKPVRFRPEFQPPTGQVIRVWVCWYDEAGTFQVSDARKWIGDLETEKEMTAEWVFAGSGFWEDPEDKREYYLADSGDMICVSNFTSAMLDVAIPSSADAGSLRFVPFETRIPEPDTPVRLVLVPVPPTPETPAQEPAESTDDSGVLDPPTAAVVPRSKQPHSAETSPE